MSELVSLSFYKLVFVTNNNLTGLTYLELITLEFCCYSLLFFLIFRGFAFFSRFRFYEYMRLHYQLLQLTIICTMKECRSENDLIRIIKVRLLRLCMIDYGLISCHFKYFYSLFRFSLQPI